MHLCLSLKKPVCGEAYIREDTQYSHLEQMIHEQASHLSPYMYAFYYSHVMTKRNEINDYNLS